MFPYKCDVYNMCSCACSCTKRRVSSHILTYEDTSVRNFKHMTPHLSHNFPQVHSKQPATSQLFNLQTLLTMQLFTYKDVSVANCHIGGRVCVQLVTKFLMFYLEHHVYTQMCRYKRCSCACSCTKRRVCAHFLTYLCITFNICHHVCHQIFHRRIRNDA